MTGAKWAVEGRTGAPRVMLGQSSMPTVRPSTGSARAWLAYPILVALFAFMGPYSLHPAAATGDDAAVGASAAAAASGVEEGTHTSTEARGVGAVRSGEPDERAVPSDHHRQRRPALIGDGAPLPLERPHGRGSG
jgi:hypothetical protein